MDFDSIDRKVVFATNDLMAGSSKLFMDADIVGNPHWAIKINCLPEGAERLFRAFFDHHEDSVKSRLADYPGRARAIIESAVQDHLTTYRATGIMRYATGFNKEFKVVAALTDYREGSKDWQMCLVDWSYHVALVHLFGEVSYRVSEDRSEPLLIVSGRPSDAPNGWESVPVGAIMPCCPVGTISPGLIEEWGEFADSLQTTLE